MTTYVKVSELPASTVLADADVFIYNDDTTTSKITYASFKSAIGSYLVASNNTFTGTTTFNGNVTFGSVTITGLVPSDFGLGNVSNTSDANKPISTATQSALDVKAPLAGPIFTGVPVAPTAAAGTNTTQIATTAFVTSAITADNVTDALLASPALTGTPTAPTASAGTNTTQVATTEFVLAEIASDNSTDALLASPALTGTPTAPTATAGTNTTQVATTAFVSAALTADNSTETLDEVATRGATTDVDLSVGDLFTVRGDGSSQDGRIKLNCSQNSHGVTIQAPPHSASATYTLTLPTTDGAAGEFLTSDGSGVLSWTGVSSVLASAALTGTPTAPTAGAGTNTTQVATTAFVTAAITADNATDLILGTSSIDALGDVDTTTAAPSSGDFLKFDGSNFVPGLPDAPTTFELSGTTLRNVTGGHLIGLRNAAAATTISLDSETGAAEFAGNATASQFHAAGTNHLVLKAATGNDFKVHLAGEETLQVTRHTGTGNTVMVAGGGTKEFTFNSPIDATAGLEISGTAITATADELNYVDGVTSNVQTQLDARAALDSPTFTTKIESPEFHSAGSHLKFKAATNDIIFYPNNTETLQITRSGTDCRFTSNGGTGTFKFNQDVTQRPGSSVTPSANGDLSVEATNDTTLTFKFKGSDGVVRSGTITLS